MKLDTLAGNAALKQQLSAQAEGRGLSHAYLISGPSGSGKRTLARLLAAAMVCSGPEEAPCGSCPGCKKALNDIHPDVITVGSDGKDLPVSQARAIRSDAYIRPNEAQRKVYIIQNAQTMNAPAQNALLKLLEEGPPYAAFLLLTDNPGALLSTIRSRCEGISLTPVSPSEATQVLRRRFPDRSSQEISAAVRRCGGFIGRAVEELEGTGEDQILSAAQELLALLSKGDELALAARCVELEKWDRENLSRLMDRETALLRDVLALQTGLPAQEELPVLLQAESALSRQKLLRCVEVLQRLRRSAGFNVGVGHLCGALCAGLSDALQ